MTSLRTKIFSFVRSPIKLSIVVVVAASLMVTVMPLPAKPASAEDNSGLTPKLLPDSQVKMEGISPDWVKTLVMAEVRVETAAPDGTLATAAKFLDHYSVMGVNGLWINPIWKRDAGGDNNGYGNYGINLVDPRITGTSDTDLTSVKNFVAQAHRRNIRVFFDVIVWGTAKGSPLVTQHPEFYAKNADGSMVQAWGGFVWDWKSSALRQWYTKAAVRFILQTGADGFRVDLAPDTSGYYFKEIREALYARGHKIAIIAEQNSDRKDTFDLDQRSVRPDPTLFQSNIVDTVKSGAGIGTAEGAGQYRFYTANLADHDDRYPAAHGNLVHFAYGTLFAPFIPLWWVGEEWNNPQTVSNVLYFNKIDWSMISGNRLSYYNTIKKFIRIRRSYPQIFDYFPSSTRNANIAKVVSTTAGGAPNPLQAYARYGNGMAILIVPNNGTSPAPSEFSISMNLSAWRLDKGRPYQVIDLLTGAVVARGKPGSPAPFTVSIAGGHLGVYLVKN